MGRILLDLLRSESFGAVGVDLMSKGRLPKRLAASLLPDTGGATAAIFAIALPVLVGMGALAVDVGIWNVQKRQAQGAADQAAYSAAVAAKAGANATNATTDAHAIAAGMGFVNGANGVTITVNSPPANGQFVGETGYWEVIVSEPQNTWLAGYFLGSGATVNARAVAGGSAGGTACIIGLNSSTGVDAITMDNNNIVSNPGCTIYSNSNFSVANNSGISGTAYAAGSFTGKVDKADLPNKVSGAAQVDDPYADLTLPSTCSGSATITGDGTKTAGSYCGGFVIDNNKTVTLSSGTYIIGSNFSLGNSVVINSTGPVTLIFMPNTNIAIGNNAAFHFDAPTTGPYAGIGMAGRNLTTNFVSWNNALFDIQGAIYFPNQTLEIKNNFSSTKCTQIVANIVQIKNNANMASTCPGSGIRSPGGSTVALLE